MKTSVRFAIHMSVMTSILTILFTASLHAQGDWRLASVSLSAPTVISGDSVEGRVTLNKPAPEDLEVTMAADPFNAAQVPVSITVKAGEISAPFKVSTVHGRILVGGADKEVGIYANYEVTQHVKLIIRPSMSLDKIMDRVIDREHAFMDNLKQLHPLAETYIQNMREDSQHNVTPISDAYFFGRLDLVKTTEEATFKKDTKGKLSHINVFALLSIPFERHYVPEGFAQMAILDRDFKKENYTFDFVRQEFLGEIRCDVIDVMPKEHAPKGLFVGRIWVEDKQFNIVRFNGTYSNGSNYNAYLHFDSWRMNMQPGVWLPAYIYSEESDTTRKTPPFHIGRFKAQTRLWNYDELHIEHPTEMTNIKVDSIGDSSEAQQDGAPLEAQRAWERLAEDNALDHMQKIGLLAMPSPVDKILQTVVNNLIITNNLEIIPEVRCRVLLTTPLESFTVGHTIVLSRGLIDVLPDEASLAMVLSHELAHIALGHKIDTKFAFNDRMFFPDPVTFQRMSFERSPMDETAADTKAMDLLNNSPYKDKLATAGLFLKELQTRGPMLPNLIRAHMGNPLDSKTGVRLASVAGAAPQLENKVEQIAALSLGARIRLDPWSNRIEMQNMKHVTMLSPADKMPLEVTPFLPYLTRLRDWSAQGPLPDATNETAAQK
jgi:peptidase M48-like protein